MKFGLNTKQWGNFYNEALEQALLAKKLGFSSIWFMEHHGYDKAGYLSSPLKALTALAGELEGMILGTNILIAPLYNPVRLAEDVAHLDVISGGRFVLGVGIGYRPEEYEALGLPDLYKRRGGWLDETIPFLRKCWSEESVAHEGKFYRVKDVRIEPRPVDKNGPSIYVGGRSRAALTRAAKLGDGWIEGPASFRSDVVEYSRTYTEESQKIGKGPKIILTRDSFVANDADSAWNACEPALTRSYLDYANHGHPVIKQDFNPREDGKDMFIVGNPDEAIAEIEKYKKEINVDHIVLRPSFNEKISHENILSAIRLVGEKVIPYFQEK